jgi:hypothetical protein
MELLAEKQDAVDVVVGYTTKYAVYVHENMESHHTVGQAKYLEQPAREMADELGTIVAKAAKRGLPLDTGLLLAGLKLQAASQKLVPVDTGNLKGSAFTRKE